MLSAPFVPSPRAVALWDACLQPSMSVPPAALLVFGALGSVCKLSHCQQSCCACKHDRSCSRGVP